VRAGGSSPGTSKTERSTCSARRSWCWRRAAAARVYFSTTQAHYLHRRWLRDGVRAGLPVQDMEFIQFHPTGVYGAGLLITEGARGEGGYLTEWRGERLHGALRAESKDSARATWVSRASRSRSARAAAAGRQRTTSSYISNISDPGLLHARCLEFRRPP